MLKDIRLACAIAVGVFAGLSAWSLFNPAPMISRHFQAAGFQRAALGSDPVDVRIVDVARYVSIPVEVSEPLKVKTECGGEKYSPCYVSIAQ